ncbi:MFS transporter [Enterovirga aerilata]|uniref:MFS transporter n=1 Tax=Enterovirga aerilata TaxID=2730920 RepID=A0A849IET7_9HYPH|nr:MFS transporter [Enterovirga sp. DB1703]
MFLALLFPYLLSQFYRAFLAVVAGDVSRDLGLDAAGLASLQAAFLLAFALCQIPVGVALDRFGPRRTLACGMCSAVIGGVLFAFAGSLSQALAAMALTGGGCAPVLMTGFYLIARTYPAARFATLSSLLLGLGSLGDPLSGTPLALAVSAFGWRPTMLGIAGIAALSLVCVSLVLRDPPRADAPGGAVSPLAGARQILAMRALWPIFPIALVSYACVIATRGLWIAPYLDTVHGFSPELRSLGATAMGFAIAAGALLYAPLNRLFGNAKYTAAAGVGISVAAWLVLGLFGERSGALAVTLLLLVACLGAPFAIIMAHARSFMPTHLLGQGVTIMNLAFMGGAGLGQWFSGRYVRAAELAGTAPSDLYGRLFTAFGLVLGATLAIYLLAPRERR